MKHVAMKRNALILLVGGLIAVSCALQVQVQDYFHRAIPALLLVVGAFMIIAGGADVSLPPEHSQQMQGLITGSSYVELPGIGHSSPIEDPAQVTAALERFLSHN